MEIPSGQQFRTPSDKIAELKTLVSQSVETEVVTATKALRAFIQNFLQDGGEVFVEPGSITIPISSASDREALCDLLADLEIYPYEEGGILVIENKRDLKKLELAGVTVTNESDVQPAERVNRSIEEKPFDNYSFPYPPGVHDSVFKDTHSDNQQPPKPLPPADTKSLEPGADTDLADIITRWDSGLLDTDDEEFKAAFGKIPNLNLFPHRYRWSEGTATDTNTGEVITKEQQMILFVRAQNNDPVALRTLTELHAGLILKVLARVQKRSAGVEADDLFQEGLLGLTEAIKRFDKDHEQVNFYSFASKYIEGRMRRNIIESEQPLRLNEEMRKIRRGYFKAVEATNTLHPDLSPDDDTYKSTFIEELEKQGLPPIFDLERIKRLALIGAVRVEPEEHEFSEHEVDMTGKDVSPVTDTEEQYVRTLLTENIDATLKTLTPREELVLRARFGLFPTERRKVLYDLLRQSLATSPYATPAMKALAAEVENADADNFDPHEFREKPFMARLYYILSGKVPVEEYHGNNDETTLEEIGKWLGLLKTMVHSIEKKALRKLKHPMRKRKLEPYIEPTDYTADSE